jgi:hypothetical protein
MSLKSNTELHFESGRLQGTEKHLDNHRIRQTLLYCIEVAIRRVLAAKLVPKYTAMWKRSYDRKQEQGRGRGSAMGAMHDRMGLPAPFCHNVFPKFTQIPKYCKR